MYDLCYTLYDTLLSGAPTWCYEWVIPIASIITSFIFYFSLIFLVLCLFNALLSPVVIEENESTNNKKRFKRKGLK